MKKWNILDHLKLEMLVHRHRNLVANGSKRDEDEANRELLNATSKDGEENEARLKAWSGAKWEQLVKIDRRLSYVDRMLWVPMITCSVALAFAILTWLPYFDQTVTRGESKPIEINVTVFLAAFVLLPFMIFLFFLVSSLIRNVKHKAISPLVDFCRRAIRGTKKINTQIHNIHATSRRDDRNAVFFNPFLSAYTWCVKTVFSFFRSKGTKLSDNSSLETHLQIGEALSQSLMQQRSTVRLWFQRNLHLFGATYFSAFLLLFFLALFSASDTPIFKSGIDASQGELSGTNRFTIIGTPFNGLIDLPTNGQINSNRLNTGGSQNEDLNARYDWKAYLMLAIVVYVILPRAVTIFIQSLWLKHRLNSVDLTALRYESLITGMFNSPALSRTGSDSKSLEEGNGSSDVFGRLSDLAEARCCVIADASLVNDSFQERFNRHVAERFKVASESRVVWMVLGSAPMNEEQFKERLKLLVEHWLPLRPGDRILHLVDASQPPKSNYKTRMKRIRETVGDKVGIIYMLIHDGAVVDDPKNNETLSSWNQRTQGWQDSNLEVEEFYTGGQQS